MLPPNQIYCGDNLDLLARVDDASARCIYSDSPFGTGHIFYLDREEIVVAYEDKYSLPDLLAMLAPRFQEYSRILSETGFLLVHGDARFIPYVRIALDQLFGIENFRNEIVWCYKSAGQCSEKSFLWNHDTILMYAKSDAARIHPDRNDFPVSEKTVARFANQADETGHVEIPLKPNQIMPCRFNLKYGLPIDWWEIAIPVGGSFDLRYGKYPTQKPLELMRRFVKACTDPGDLVVEPFAGGATFCYAAKELDRQYIGMDNSEVAVNFARDRLTHAKRQARLPVTPKPAPSLDGFLC